MTPTVEDGEEIEQLLRNSGEVQWFEVRDMKSKRLFYFNNVTQISQWERPVGVNIVRINQTGSAVILGSGVFEKAKERRSGVNRSFSLLCFGRLDEKKLLSLAIVMIGQRF